MKSSRIMGLMALLCLPLLSTTLHAETVTVDCASYGDFYRECQVNGEIESAVMTQRYSNSECIRGESWGYRRGGNTLWVNDGCRARFRVRLSSGDGHRDDSFTMRCESIGSNSRRCDTGVRNYRVVLERQISSASCRLGRSWDWDRYYIRVSGGCRGIFRVYPY
ncbi:MAG: DUF3011 domain-containing protein [Bdellovibrionota bacterium]